MAYKFKTIEKIVGVFVVVAGIITLIAIILIALGYDFFQPSYYYYTEFMIFTFYKKLY